MIIETKINTQEESFIRQLKAMKKKVQALKQLEEKVRTHLTSQALEKLKAKNKYPVRKRIDLLKDQGAKFLEFSTLAGFDLYKEHTPCAGLITGIAPICNQPCVIIANDPGVKGGAYFPITIKKHLRAQEMALENHLPCIYLVDSGGAYLPYQDQVFPDKEHFGRIFYNQSRLSAQGIPQISAVLGHCTAGGAYVPALSDENIIVKGNGTIFLAGPPLVKSATGETTSAEELGGAELHTSQSGVSDYIVENEDSALEKIRNIISRLNISQKSRLKKQNPEEPLYPAEEIYGLLPEDLKSALPAKEVLARLLDGSRLDEFKKNYGRTLVTGFAHICGCPVGVLANQGVLFSESALKAVHFIDLCDKRKIPLLFLQNITGFMVGKKYEAEGISKQGAKMVSAVSLARVPKFTVIMGASFGAGNYGMCGRAYQPRMLWTWPSARTAVMGGKQAEQVLQTLKSSSLKTSLADQYEKQSSAYYSTARLWDDGLIDPADTRQILAMGLDAACYAPPAPQMKAIYRM